ncbi:MAG TPA: NAD(P)H-dependent oxidoreductase subunit E [Chloroflexia bacterium]|nr:NAD(P)H-dependent oxidoreductase subunit E [Chloroflexia bacterium]
MSLIISRGGSSEGSNPGTSIEMAKVNAIFERYTTWNANEALIPMMQEIQHEFGYVPDVLAALISEQFDIPLTQIYGVATFYSDFRVLEKAEHRVLLCEGSACYLCGSQALHRAVREKYGVDYGEVTPDGKFILERANFCFGACQLMPMVEIDHTFYGNVTPERLLELIENVTKGDGEHAETIGEH